MVFVCLHSVAIRKIEANETSAKKKKIPNGRFFQCNICTWMCAKFQNTTSDSFNSFFPVSIVVAYVCKEFRAGKTQILWQWRKKMTVPTRCPAAVCMQTLSLVSENVEFMHKTVNHQCKMHANWMHINNSYTPRRSRATTRAFESKANTKRTKKQYRK